MKRFLQGTKCSDVSQEQGKGLSLFGFSRQRRSHGAFGENLYFCFNVDTLNVSVSFLDTSSSRLKNRNRFRQESTVQLRCNGSKSNGNRTLTDDYRWSRIFSLRFFVKKVRL